MRKTLIILAVAIWITSIGAGQIDFEAQGFEVMATTAYCMGHTTADGSSVHHGGCACSPDHIGDVAIVYTTGGNFLGYYECNDTGAGGVRAGMVLDIYRKNLTMCNGYMRITQGKVYVKWIKGNG